MNDRTHPTETLVPVGLLDDEALRALKAAQEHARTLRAAAIAGAQAQLRAVAAALEVSPEELLGLPARKRRSRSKPETE